jgi:hypothetical protein
MTKTTAAHALPVDRPADNTPLRRVYDLVEAAWSAADGPAVQQLEDALTLITNLATNRIDAPVARRIAAESVPVTYGSALTELESAWQRIAELEQRQF